MQRYTNFIASTTATNSTLTVLSNASCVVYIAGTLGAATLYSDNGVTPLANPFLSSATGMIDFYAANGRYDVVVSKTGYLSVTISDIELDDLMAPSGAGSVGNTPAGSISATTVQGAINEIVSDLLASSGSNSVGYLPAGTGAVASTVQTKLREIKSAADYSTFPNYTSNALSAGFFTQNGAVIQRMTDRLMVGGATLNDCAFPNVYQDWLTTFQIAAGLGDGAVSSAQSAVLNANQAATGGSAFLAGAQSLNSASAATSTIASGHYAVNNNATLATSAWALYAEAHKTNATTASIYACELDTRTLAASTGPTPFQQGSVVGIQIASGCGLSAVGQFDASCAIQIEDNPMKFKAGINFGSNSIVGTDGITGTGNAISMAKGHRIIWYNSAGAEVGGIHSGATTSALATKIYFADSGLIISSPAGGQAISYFTPVASSVNWLQFTAAATGDPPLIAAAGTDTNVDLRLSTQGTGVLRYGTYTAGVVAQAGYVTIKDSGGTLRRLLVG